MATAPPVAVEEAAAEGDVVAAAEEREPEEPQPGPPSDDEKASFPCPPCDIKEQCCEPQVAAEPSAAAVGAVPDSAAAAAAPCGDRGQDQAPTRRADNLIDGDHLPPPEMLIISLTLMIFGGVRTYVGSPKQRYLRG